VGLTVVFNLRSLAVKPGVNSLKNKPKKTMGNGFQFIDIIFFAMIAIFLVLRLRGVLGKRDGNEGANFRDLFNPEPPEGESAQENNVVNLAERNPKPGLADDAHPEHDLEAANDVTAKPAADDGPLAAGYAQIQRLDPGFNEEDFLVGARVAFEMILNGYASGDTDTLRALLSNEVYSNFAKAIQDRERAGHVMEDTLVGIMKSDLVEIFMEGTVAHVTVKFVSEQVNAVHDENGDVVEGDPGTVLTVTDFWTFAHDTKSADPNWTLVATRSLD